MKQNIIDRINHLANEKEPFLFVINYAGSEAYIRSQRARLWKQSMRRKAMTVDSIQES